MATSTEAVVVGGGATGVGVARDLALRGVDVALLERGGLGSGTSGRSHGLLHSGARYATSDPDDAAECARENRTLRRIGGDCVRETGGLLVQLAEDDPAHFERAVAACRSVGIDAEVVDAASARATVPDLSQSLERAARVPDAVVYPSRLVAATAADARDRGATIHTHTPVTDVHVERTDAGRRVTGVTADGVGRVEAEYVVNAAGAWAGECGALAGVDVGVRPTRGVMVAVEYSGLGAVLNRCRPPDDGDIVVPHAEQAVLGTTSVAVTDPDSYPREDWEVERTVAECAKMLPDLSDCPVKRRYWGVRPLYAPDEEARGDERSISRGFALLDHATDGAEGFASVLGGKLTTHRLMAEATADLVCERLGVGTDCRTAERPLPAADDPARLDELVAAFDAGGPADADVVDAGPT